MKIYVLSADYESDYYCDNSRPEMAFLDLGELKSFLKKNGINYDDVECDINEIKLDFLNGDSKLRRFHFTANERCLIKYWEKENSFEGSNDHVQKEYLKNEKGKKKWEKYFKEHIEDMNLSCKRYKKTTNAFNVLIPYFKNKINFCIGRYIDYLNGETQYVQYKINDISDLSTIVNNNGICRYVTNELCFPRQDPLGLEVLSYKKTEEEAIEDAIEKVKKWIKENPNEIDPKTNWLLPKENKIKRYFEDKGGK